MTSKKTLGIRSVFHIYIVFFLLLIIITAIGIITSIYIVRLERPDGTWVTSAWPKQFTDSFSRHLILSEGVPRLNQSGMEQLRQYDLWFQLLDESGNSILDYNTAEDIPSSYSAADLIHIANGGSTVAGTTLFTGIFRMHNKSWSYIVGFPVNIARVNMYLNGDRFINGKTTVSVILGIVLIFIFFAGLIYGLWITRQMAKIKKSIFEISGRSYIPVKSSGIFGDIYESLKRLDTEIRISDETREDTERMREEWIANITHDLKTPLSPIRGYAELIADTEAVPVVGDVQRYGTVILKNAFYAESLINDLKLTYQLRNNILPLQKIELNVVHYIREFVIDILNIPDYEHRSICFESSQENITVAFDPSLLKRAINNLIINALVHNPEDAEVNINVHKSGGIQIIISDNGNGMEAHEVDKLFVRYYRGGASGEKPEGTGLGMAIAKQIIELHGGQIHVESEIGIGTKVIIIFPE